MSAVNPGLLTDSDLLRPSWSTTAAVGASETLTPAGDPTIEPRTREITIAVSKTLQSQPWFRPTLGQLAEYLRLGDNWDGYGARPIHDSAVKRAVAVLDAVCPAGPEPWIVPTPEGGLQIEWASDGLEIEIEILASGPAQVLIVEPSGEESEFPVFSDSTDTWDLLRDRIAEMRCRTT